MSTGKKILIALFIGMFIPPISVICANFLIMYLFWYFTVFGFRGWLRHKKLERRLRAENRRRPRSFAQDDYTVDGGVIYPENYRSPEELKLRYR